MASCTRCTAHVSVDALFVAATAPGWGFDTW